MIYRKQLVTGLLLLSASLANLDSKVVNLPFAKPESVGMSTERLERIDENLNKLVDSGELPGAVSLVARHGKIVHYENYGLRDLESGNPMEKDTLVRIYSMTKPVVSSALMMLHEEGKFQLNEPVSKYIPQFKDQKVMVDGELVEPKRQMTIQHLFNHTSGLTYGIFGNSEVDKLYNQHEVLRKKSSKEFLETLGSIPLKNHPGDKYVYSVSVDVQGCLVEILSGMPLDKFLQERVFIPLG
ncbi:MAG: serine hydrolase, partial [Verrucomicrobia bacterium]|nr:serine hydrolase [Verrucomicrobiota bacterium]